ncbi:MAG: DNA mismatch repair endonuclease MutL [Lentisphaeria bacterium]|nr:DNA mismatch repair endonuclease MutL [Lentisphaeria bacterium]
MSSIRILPPETANRIAAGEVVERPASVVKELVENAVDAGASRITVAIQQGGRRLIQVSDNGCGMDHDDALLCLEAHATSKIRDSFDIDRIATLGFRGEALPSIAAVSQFQLHTRQADDISGTEVLVNGGEIQDVRPCGCAPGTHIQVRNVFFNLPARKKFLRTPQTEDGHIQETVLMQALAHPGVAFELRLNDQRVLQVSGETDRAARVAMLLGRELYDGMLSVDYQEGAVSVTGFIARPGVTRARRRDQRAFVNGRPAEAMEIYAGLKEAYQSLVMKGRYPPSVLYITVPPDMVDVNVHPTKREVRFRDGRAVSAIIAAAVRRALRPLAGPRAAPVTRAPQSEQDAGLGTDMSANPAPTAINDLLGRQRELRGLRGTAAAAPVIHTTPPDSFRPPPGTDHGPMSQSGSAGSAPDPDISALRVLGVYQNRHIVAEGHAGLVMIDFKAAVERILFEKLLRAAREKEGIRQPLLIPVTLELGAADHALLSRVTETFNIVGFDIEPFGGDTFLVTAVPVNFPQENISGMIRDMLDDLREGGAGAPRPDDLRIARAAATRAAREAGEPNDITIPQVLADLSKTEMPYAAPSGRAVMINIPTSEINRRFGIKR